MWNQESFWSSLKKNFPLKDIMLGFIIPKIIFFIGVKQQAPFLGGIIGLFWCLGIFAIGWVSRGKVNIFALAAVVMIIARISVFMARSNPQLYLLVQALDSAIYAFFFLGSLFFKRSLIQFFAEESGAEFPEEIRKTPYYARAWRIITASWGMAYAFFALILVLLKIKDIQLIGLIDMLATWPIAALLFIFSLQFPWKYWQRNYAKIQEYK